ncbi:hypothetical protein EIP86_000389 [Pleurotus ostreatoroseus]|nr:hypothetical protein EIP86_000389 [Pleurotus ostreatoroseus]
MHVCRAQSQKRTAKRVSSRRRLRPLCSLSSRRYILALERRLHQVEALLGTIISADDPRARGLIDDLSRDQLAAHIIRRVKVGPFGPRGRLQQPFGSTKEDFLAAIMTGSVDDSPTRSHFQEENLALISPDRDWQDRLQTLLSSARQSGAAPQYTQAPASYTLPSLRQLASPTGTPPQQQQLLASGLPAAVSYSPAKLESPVSSSALLAPLGPAYAPANGAGSYGRMQWPAESSAGFGGGGGGGGGGSGLQRSYGTSPSPLRAGDVREPCADWPRGWHVADDGLLRPDQDVKGNYELASAPQGAPPLGARETYRSLQRAQQNR